MEEPKKSLFEQKLLDPSTTLDSLLTHDLFFEMFRAGNPLLFNFLNTSHYRRLISFVTTVGLENDKLRNYQFPQLACDIFVSNESLKITQILFTPTSESKRSELIYQILDYFKFDSPNYVLSGYVIKIVGNLYFHHPLKIQQYVLKGGYSSLMLNFLESKSIAEFLIRLIVIEDDTLLNSMFQERKQLLHQVISLYTNKDTDTETKVQVAFMLTDILSRLWTHKHKESGRFSPEIFKLIEVALNQEYVSFPDHENLVSVVMKNIANHVDAAPFIIKKITKRVLKELSTFQSLTLPASHNTPVPVFTQKNLKFLTGLTHLMGHLSVIEDVLKQQNIFGLLLSLMEKFQWNNIIQIEIEKIFRSVFISESQVIYHNVFVKGEFLDKMTKMVDKEKSSKRFGTGYSGCVTKILTDLGKAIKKESIFGQLVKKHNPSCEKWVFEYLSPKIAKGEVDLAGFKLNVGYSTPRFDDDDLLLKYSKFLDNHPNTDCLRSSIQTKEQLEEIQGESDVNQQLVVEEDKQESHKQEITI